MGKGSTWSCERVGHPEGAIGWKILHGELAIPHDAVNIKHMQRARDHSMALVRPRAIATPHHHFGHAQYSHERLEPDAINGGCMRPGP